MTSDTPLYLKIKSNFDSLNHIKTYRASVARFGDGEIDIIAGQSIPYQTYDAQLAETLKEILAYQSDDKFLVCLPDVFERIERYNDFARDFWTGHLDHYKELYQGICTADWYGSTFLSRPYIDLEDKTLAKDYFDQLRTLWEDQDILIVEGETSRSGVGNNLFQNARSIERIIGPSKNAYAQLDWLENTIRQHGKGKLILLMLGPTAKVISYRLAKEGYWTVDLGHIDSEYEWYKMGATHKVKLKNKHTAEHNLDQDIELQDDQDYENQIIAKFGQAKSQQAIDDQLAQMPKLSEDSKAVLSGKTLDLISIIVPIYNVEQYLAQCVESILKQTYTNIEILLINDGSTDHSKDICEKFAQQDNRVQVIHKTNSGVSDTRNLGIENARGNYLAFIDSDDFIADCFIERLYVEVIRHQVPIAVTDYNKLDTNNGMFLFHTHEPYTKLITTEDYLNEIFKTSILSFVVPWGKLIATSLFNGEFPIRFPSGMIVGEDKMVTYLLAQKAQNMVYIHEPTYTYRLRDNSATSSSISLKKIEDDLIGCEQRMLDLVLTGYNLKGPIDWYHYILEIHQNHLQHAGQENTDLYRKIKKKLALITKTYK